MSQSVHVPALLSLAVSLAVTACNSGQPPVANNPDTPDEAPITTATSAQLQELAVMGGIVGDSTAGQLAESKVVAAGASNAQQQSAGASVGRAEMQRIPAVPGAFSQHDGYFQPVPEQRENYASLEDNGIKRASTEPVSTFSIDVDTGAYSNARRFITNGQLPPADSVRAEEFVNYFDYDYPRNGSAAPFSIITELAASPWHEGRHLLHVGIHADTPDAGERPASNLVFLVDVSGSMQSPDKLDLLKTSLKMLTRQLGANDTIAMVVYAGASGVVLQPTAGNKTAVISAALEQLQAGGSTNGAAGIELAYSLAQQHFKTGGINRVLLATDGDFNVGTTDFEALIDLIETKRRTGISLTTLGFGSGNYNDHLMEQLADAGNGNHAYIDNLNEARKVLVDEVGSTLQTVAQDVKIQIEFNPAVVSEYRLVGYENRMLAQEDFNNDKVDAGEIGAGHTVTALYEITLAGSPAVSVDPLRYGTLPATQVVAGGDLAEELAWLKLRYKEPGGDSSHLLEQPVRTRDIQEELAETSTDYRFAAAVAGFAQLLRDNSALGSFGYDDVITLATAAKGSDDFGYRAEFIGLAKTVQVLAGN